MKKLTQVLNRVGKPTKLFKSSDGTRVLVLPYGGRVLGLFAPGSEENFYWTHTALNSPESAREFYGGDQWHNSGGDRTWLAPEADLFFPNFPKLDKYFQQRSLDPGKYQVSENNGAFSLVNRLTVNFSRLKKDVPLKITKSFGPALNPLRHERGIDLGGVEYAGYTQYTSLAITGSNVPGKAQVGLWNLVQMPHGGDLLIPTFARSEPRHIFSTIDTIPPRDLLTSDHLIRYRMRQKGEHKISVRAVSVCGRVGYIHPAGDNMGIDYQELRGESVWRVCGCALERNRLFRLCRAGLQCQQRAGAVQRIGVSHSRHRPRHGSAPLRRRSPGLGVPRPSSESRPD